jgi:hypothetical protein
MKVFDGITRSAWWTFKTLQAAEDLLEQEKDHVELLMSYVKTDCLHYQKRLSDDVLTMRKAMRDEVAALQTHLFQNVSAGLRQLSMEISRASGLWKEMRRKVDESNSKLLQHTQTTTTTIPPTSTASLEVTTDGITADYNASYQPAAVLQCSCPTPEPINLTEIDRNAFSVHVKPLYNRIIYDVKIVGFNLLDTMRKAVQELKDHVSYFALQHDEFSWFLPYMSVSSDWTLTDNDENLITILGSRVLRIIEGEQPAHNAENLRAMCHNAEFKSQDSIAAFLCKLLDTIQALDARELMSNATFLDVDDYSDDVASQLVNRIQNQSAEIPESLRRLTQRMFADLESASRMSESILGDVASMCGGRLQKLYDDYADVHSRTEWTMHEVTSNLQRYIDKYEQYRTDYNQGPKVLTLQELYGMISFESESVFVQGKFIAIESLLQDRIIALNGTEDHTNRLYFWFMATTSEQSSALRGAYCGYFEITCSGFTVPEFPVTNSNHTNLNPGVAMKSPKIIKHWSSLRKKIEKLQHDIDENIRRLLGNMKDSGAFFQDFMAGNVVDEAFYK